MFRIPTAKSRMPMLDLKKITAALGLCLIFLQPVSAWALQEDDRWRNLSPRERENVIKNYKRWKNLPPQDKEHLREEWDRWQNLPKDRREQLRDRYEDLRRRKKQE
jgi:Protein of unknown function (DUF3106)